ncbi:DoxX family protein [Flagellimonas allohymeniacidonis]|uniref:DoxX family protein n=1 Tax=Flagellimonas allohymeniacidonis TaxID=2517819 RepID=A0A4Q8Q9U4_9FLAO|nr:DoxX family protein [Allomuricauda hymeniacidonis]TAI47001.1 DoxX family protein [Allomuricauda hymeniacidonis]
MNSRYIKLFLRAAIATAFLSAVADRLGLWPEGLYAWGNWDSFVQSTEAMNPWFPPAIIPAVAFMATALEVVFALCLLIGFKTELFAKLSGYLLLAFALAITFSSNIKGSFDYSVFTAAAAAFALSLLREKHWELDTLIFPNKV